MVRIRENEKLPKKQKQIQIALAGNRTRASRVAGENSTTEPPVPTQFYYEQKVCRGILHIHVVGKEFLSLFSHRSREKACRPYIFFCFQK